MRVLLITLIAFLVVGCIQQGNSSKNDDVEFDEICYDGVVYLSSTRYDSNSVKFTAEGTIATTTVNGKVCKPHTDSVY